MRCETFALPRRYGAIFLNVLSFPLITSALAQAGMKVATGNRLSYSRWSPLIVLCLTAGKEHLLCRATIKQNKHPFFFHNIETHAGCNS